MPENSSSSEAPATSKMKNTNSLQKPRNREGCKWNMCSMIVTSAIVATVLLMITVIIVTNAQSEREAKEWNDALLAKNKNRTEVVEDVDHRTSPDLPLYVELVSSTSEPTFELSNSTSEE